MDLPDCTQGSGPEWESPPDGSYGTHLCLHGPDLYRCSMRFLLRRRFGLAVEAVDVYLRNGDDRAGNETAGLIAEPVRQTGPGSLVVALFRSGRVGVCLQGALTTR